MTWRARKADYAALQHLTVREAAVRLGVSIKCVRAAARRHGFRYRPARTGPDAYRALQHLTTVEAAARLGVATHTVRTMARRHGLTFRPMPVVRVKLTGLGGAALCARLFEVGHLLPRSVEERVGRKLRGHG